MLNPFVLTPVHGEVRRVQGAPKLRGWEHPLVAKPPLQHPALHWALLDPLNRTLHPWPVGSPGPLKPLLMPVSITHCCSSIQLSQAIFSRGEKKNNKPKKRVLFVMVSILPISPSLPGDGSLLPAAWDVFVFITIVTTRKYLGFCSGFASLEEAGNPSVYLTAFCMESHDSQLGLSSLGEPAWS